MARKPRYAPPRTEPPRRSAPIDPPRQSGWFNLNYASVALLGMIFVVGIGVGIAFSSTASFNPENVASREVIDRSAPNAELCVQFGASAIVTDMRFFVTLNPFNVFVTQPRMLPGCVMRRNNWSILEQRNLLTGEQVRDCKQRMNTFGYTGVLEGKPDISCIYQNDAAGNLFLNQPGVAGARPESGSF
ncbi:MAG: DUF3172 domain-containing protein [Chloroflexaceae bacterium]|nr:DUF3172 domain-containing protein [Chloroflexaceae bacterium]